MPLYVYRCPLGHETELLRPRSVEAVPCACGETAGRESVNRIGFTGFARAPVDQREIRMGEYLEAREEVAYQHERQTNIDGSLKPEPPLWQAAKAKANHLMKLGVKDSADLRT